MRPVRRGNDVHCRRRQFTGLTLDLVRQIESGIGHVNGATVQRRAADALRRSQASGWGRFGGEAAIEEFTKLRWITVQQGSRHYPL